MPITYNTVERGTPGVEGGGEKKFYANSVATGETDIDELTRQIENNSTVSSADIQGVLYSLINVVPFELAKGNIVRLGTLGSFRISLSSNGHETPEEVGPNSIRKSKILFTPGPKFKDMLATLKFTKGAQQSAQQSAES